MDTKQLERMRSGKGFIAALDQSGGSTPKALALYGIPQTDYSTEEEMFDLVHAMRTRIITAPSFDSERILGAILFEMTMDREIEGIPTADFLYEKKGVVPFLKIDKGLAEEANGVRLMKPIDGLDNLLKRAVQKHIFGTKMRSVIKEADSDGIKAIVQQQFELAHRIASYGLVPIIEPEVDISIPDKAEAEAMLKEEFLKRMGEFRDDEYVMFKLSIPSKPNFYDELLSCPFVVRVVALSGGYPQKEANRLLAKNHHMIASFSRALSEGLTAQMDDREFDSALKRSIDSIYKASIA